MPFRLHQFEIQVPADPAVLAAYESLGWYRLDNPPRLKWSHARGSPRHPGQAQEVPTMNGLRLLDVQLLNELERHLPIAGSVDGNHIDLRVVITVKYRKVERRQRHKGAAPLATWHPADAELMVLSIEECAG